jgi:hypothetical protein
MASPNSQCLLDVLYFNVILEELVVNTNKYEKEISDEIAEALLVNPMMKRFPCLSLSTIQIQLSSQLKQNSVNAEINTEVERVVIFFFYFFYFFFLNLFFSNCNR